jgi:protein-S-isoprenylcysteine O-methyltransferase Ste14
MRCFNMIVIRRDKEDEVEDNKSRSIMPLIKILFTFLILFILIPIGITLLFHLSWYLSFIYPFGIIIGLILIISGVWIIYMGIKGLRLRYSSSGYEKGEELVTTGIYGYTRNPMYFGASIMIFGWFLVLPFTFILIGGILFLFLFYFTAKSEEKQLHQKYGKKYLSYKRKVPLFIPIKINK